MILPSFVGHIDPVLTVPAVIPGQLQVLKCSVVASFRFQRTGIKVTINELPAFHGIPDSIFVAFGIDYCQSVLGSVGEYFWNHFLLKAVCKSLVHVVSPLKIKVNVCQPFQGLNGALMIES